MVTRAYYRTHQNYPQLVVEFDDGGEPGVFDQESFKWFWRGRNVVYIGRDRGRTFRINGTDFNGLTDDPAIVELVLRFRRDCNDGSFVEGEIYPKSMSTP